MALTVYCDECGAEDATVCGLCLRSACLNHGPCRECYYPMSENELRRTALSIIQVASAVRKRRHLPHDTPVRLDMSAGALRKHYTPTERGFISALFSAANVEVEGW